jgi:hypothetical protein
MFRMKKGLLKADLPQGPQATILALLLSDRRS